MAGEEFSSDAFLAEAAIRHLLKPSWYESITRRARNHLIDENYHFLSRLSYRASEVVNDDADYPEGSVGDVVYSGPVTFRDDFGREFEGDALVVNEFGRIYIYGTPSIGDRE